MSNEKTVRRVVLNPERKTRQQKNYEIAKKVAEKGVYDSAKER